MTDGWMVDEDVYVILGFCVLGSMGMSKTIARRFEKQRVGVAVVVGAVVIGWPVEYWVTS